MFSRVSMPPQSLRPGGASFSFERRLHAGVGRRFESVDAFRGSRGVEISLDTARVGAYATNRFRDNTLPAAAFRAAMHRLRFPPGKKRDNGF
jgi:hypothetical protein